MSDPDESRTITGWQKTTRYYRRKPGPGWLLALIVVPVLLALLQWGVLDTSRGDTAAAPSTTAVSSTAAPALSAEDTAPAVDLAPLSILRSGNDIAVTGEVPDLAAKTSLLDGLATVFGPPVNLIDNLTIHTGVRTVDFGGVAAAFAPTAGIVDFGWNLAGNTVTLTGSAPSDAVKADTEKAARAAWPDLLFDNEIRVVPGVAPPPVAAAPAPAGGCPALQGDITALLQTPISFDTAGFTLTAGSEQLLTGVADKIKACPEAKIAVSGYTDNSGSDAINLPLSQNRAKAVAGFLVSQGIPAGNVTSQGFGSANPVAGNDTPEGRIKNRRVEITVS
ncbi:MAG: OmpA family protein [Mycobacterium sp.]|nr:OmpA family protein [Mycobacterium sp.]